MADGLTFQIHPAGEIVSLDLFVRTLEDVRKLVIEVDYAVNRERSGKRWAVTQLHSSAPTFTIAPVIAGLEEPMEAIVSGIGEIAGGTDHPPQNFSETALLHLQKMRRHFRGHEGARNISVSVNGHEPAWVTRETVEQTSKILNAGYWSLGSVEGRLESINFHNNPTFTIWDRVSRAPVRCTISREQTRKDMVKSLLEKRVLVEGKIRYFSNGFPRSISEIREISDKTPDPTLPRAEFGCIPDAEAASDPAKFLRKIRGYDED